MKEDIVIRWVMASDLDQLVALCTAHAEYERADYDGKGKADQLYPALFSERPKLYCLVVEHNGGLVGFISFMKQYATWDAGEYVYMDCLYLEEAYRGKGIGKSLVQKMVKEANRLGCTLIQWQTPTFNTRAIPFYERLGATRKPKERFFLEVSEFQWA